MRGKALSRYQRTADGKLIIEIAAGKIEDLYDDFDKYAPYVRKELDQDLVEYLIDSVSEIGDEEFVINFRLAILPDGNMMERVRLSIYNYFLYLIEKEQRKLARMSRASLIYFLIGISILCLYVYISHAFNVEGEFFAHVLIEGLNVAAWVSLWNAIATLLVNWSPQRQIIQLYRRITSADIYFDSMTNGSMMSFEKNNLSSDY